jgi:hypothetical protein
MLITAFAVDILCPGCGWVLMRHRDVTLECVNHDCEYAGRRFKAPTIPIELIPISKEDANAHSRGAGNTGGPADA